MQRPLLIAAIFAVQGETYEPGNHTVDRSDFDVDWRDSKLAAQQGLGLRPEWCIGRSRHHLDCATAHGTALRVAVNKLGPAVAGLCFGGMIISLKACRAWLTPGAVSRSVSLQATARQAQRLTG